MSGSDRPGGAVDRQVCVLSRASGVVAIRKPGGLPTQAPAGIDSAELRVRGILHDGRTEGYLGVPHRLDRVVSGVMLFAETPRAARKLSRQFERRQVVKRYRALVLPSISSGSVGGRREQSVGEDWQEWRDWLAKRRGVAAAAVVDPFREPRGSDADAFDPPREALTRARLAGGRAGVRFGAAGDRPGLLELEFEPVTGRMHQIRVQAASRGLPVFGDIAYGCPLPHGDSSARDPRSATIALHASSITYLDPDSGRPITITSDPPWQRDTPAPDRG
jgi:23S rRNA pseudouridine1911/1915/1917 synthase